MKSKILATLIISLGLGFGAGTAYAESVTIGTPITDTECDAIGEDVNPSLSKGVHAAFKCDNAKNLITVGACHENGRKKVEKIPCAIIGEWGGEVKWNGTCANADDTVDTTVDIGKGYIGSNAGGSVAGAALDAACSDDSVDDLTPDVS
ncbi:hypothetical protein [Thauera sp. SDU_THAU2]|uniref:hypothetical protein n=1 Tax=Thauera sp. SDU_THAU2 TaxID=3136633 RepID=UPI00311ECFBA